MDVENWVSIVHLSTDPDSSTLVYNAWYLSLEAQKPEPTRQGIEGNTVMLRHPILFVVYAWNYVFNHKVSPVRSIPDIAVRHYILQTLGIIWAFSFAIATATYTVLPYSILGHSLLIAAAAITVCTLTAASKKPETVVRVLGRRHDGEHA
jgi:hypothetical protein